MLSMWKSLLLAVCSVVVFLALIDGAL